MRGLIFDIKHFAIHDGPGIRTTVFFSGCPLKCVWCHNPEGLKRKIKLGFFADKCTSCGKCTEVCPSGAQIITATEHRLERERCILCAECTKSCPTGALTVFGREVEAYEVVADMLEDRDFYESSGGGVTLSGGECTVQIDFCEELLRRFKAAGVHTAVDTCGYAPRESFERIIPYTDLFLYDIKAIDRSVHEYCTGVSNELILDNLRYLDSRGCEIEVRIPYVPGCNSGEIDRIAEFLHTLGRMPKVRILPYHNYAGSKYSALGIENTLPNVELPTDAKIAELTERVTAVCG